MTDLDVLERLQEIFGGNINEVSVGKEHYKRAWRWAITNPDDTMNCIDAIYNHLLSRRKQSADLAIEAYERYCEDRIEREFKAKERRLTILELKRYYNYTHKDIASIVGVSRPYVTKVLNGTR